MKKYLSNIVNRALQALKYEEFGELVFEKPKNEVFGDLTANIAMLIAKKVVKNPRSVAQEIIQNLEVDKKHISNIEIAGPGFINFRFTDEFFTSQVETILKNADSYGRTKLGGGKKTQVEYVSANPTGPLSVGHGRQAALGDTIANLLQWTGHQVTREYYYNNA